MTVVVADSSPLNYLVLIGSIDILQELFNKILVPAEVIAELRATAAPSRVRAWAEALPDWMAERLLGTNFRVSTALIDELLADDDQRR